MVWLSIAHPCICAHTGSDCIHEIVPSGAFIVPSILFIAAVVEITVLFLQFDNLLIPNFRLKEGVCKLHS